jgi:hypothetical protein
LRNLVIENQIRNRLINYTITKFPNYSIHPYQR